MSIEIEDHPFRRSPGSILIVYPGILDLLKKEILDGRDILGYREFKDGIQYKRWTCRLTFLWTFSEGHFFIENVRIYQEKLAPLEQHEY